MAKILEVIIDLMSSYGYKSTFIVLAIVITSITYLKFG